MGQRIKLTDQKKAWATKQGRYRGRNADNRGDRQRFLIVCEGEKTEPNYIKAIQRELPAHVIQLEIHGKGANTLSLVEMARQIRDGRAKDDYEFDQVWIVFDRDSFPPANFDNAIQSAEANDMHCAWSNEAFEIWYILHFEYHVEGMSRTDYQAKLTGLLGKPYRKNAVDIYAELSQKGNQNQAISWAKRLHANFYLSHTPPSRSNPCTTVYALIEELNGFMPVEGRE